MSHGLTFRGLGVAGLLAIVSAYVVGHQRDEATPRNVRSDVAHHTAPNRRATLPSYPLAVELTRRDGSTKTVSLCQTQCGPFCGVDCSDCGRGGGEPRWNASHPIPWEVFAQGEYVGPARTQHVPDYHLRVDDVLEFVYWFTNEARDEAYRFQVGDEVIINSLTDENINRGSLEQGRGLMVQPDGTITVILLGQIPAAGRTVTEE